MVDNTDVSEDNEERAQALRNEHDANEGDFGVAIVGTSSETLDNEHIEKLATQLMLKLGIGHVIHDDIIRKALAVARRIVELNRKG